MNPESLARQLEALLVDSGEAVGPIVDLRRRPSRYRSTHALDEVDLRFADGSRRVLLLKGYGASSTRGGSAVRPSFVTDPYRELWAYEQVLSRLAVRTPRLYGTLRGDGDNDRMVIERSPGVELYDEGDPEAWASAARWLGEFHTRGRRLVGDLLGCGHLLIQDSILHRHWLRRAQRFALGRGRRGVIARLRALADPYRRAIAFLEREPRTLLHGEYYASNVLVCRTGAGWSVSPVDWESLAIGPAALDVAALISGGWDRETRARMISAHAETVAEGADAPASTAICAAELVIAVQWLGWSDRWTPPPQHAHDWLHVATDAAARLQALGQEQFLGSS